MKLRSLKIPYITLAAIFALSPNVFADLKTKSELLIEQYESARKQGLIRLNEKYIGLLKKELANAMNTRKLDESNFIKKQIDKLVAENTKLGTTPKDEKRTEEAMNLEKKTISFPHERQPDLMVSVEFEKGTKATFVGLGNARVEWTYDKGDKPSVYHFWSHTQGRTKEGGFRVDIDPGGKTATVSKPGSSYSVKATIKRTR